MLKDAERGVDEVAVEAEQGGGSLVVVDLQCRSSHIDEARW